jgi:hypothetical protein
MLNKLPCPNLAKPDNDGHNPVSLITRAVQAGNLKRTSPQNYS